MSVVPNLFGLTAAAATTALTSAGLTLGTTTYSAVYSAAGPGEVQGQSLPAGYQAAAGAAVNIVVSQIVPPFSIEQTVIAQYANSPIMMALVNNFAQYFDPTQNLSQFYTIMWNIFTATGFGLDVWGRILGITRYLTVPEEGSYFGFVNDGEQDFTGFDQSPFYSGAADTTTYPLTDTEFLPLLLAKALANITRSTLPFLNRLLLMLYGADGAVWVQDNGNMSLTVVFNFTPSAAQLAIITESGVFPSPTGIVVSTQTV